MSWLDQRGDSCLLKDIIAFIQNNEQKWKVTKNTKLSVECPEGNITMDYAQQFSWRDTFSLAPQEHLFKLTCLSDVLFLVLPGLSIIVTGNQIYCRQSGVKEAEAVESWLTFLETCSSVKSMGVALEGEQAAVEELFPILIQFVGDFLRFLWNRWKSVDYSCPSKKDLQSSVWRELAQNWISSFHQLLTEMKLFVSMVSSGSAYDGTITRMLPSPVVFIDEMSELLNEMYQWQKTVDRVDNLIPLYFHQQETLLLKLDLPIVTGSAFFGFVLLVMSFTCMNITIPPYNSPNIIQIWAVFISILVLLLFFSFSSMFYWLRKNAPLTDL
ncbi:hypothetical protein Gasu2_12370 [Galdieria sulphuraria]|uniref:Uncharacterized protein n=1 Tax=Galdieria sulphuraria TaxID=130081 RepID=M2XIF7_GALSU|nr:hypothetical protein Gasu_28540 isoform 2 [Galdieria sulphuraria]XP_005706378.1 hypothetical protein Gasu_28540 isoform 1 [Galdieria sulphuraria]EME29857.1 hypothetical protein isoform 2 [Galdieria sulphuraria]EME29858.1 hypothetical protein isoform 1 [Galdieria sulphuraria]GJD06846.1 hypothetical protein Gasu2_12370 [Galdieria sulphuraria]|eukprot:XP_005706377.1 hypothetical protein isoform 2 [Galdieria sulphuraria]